MKRVVIDIFKVDKPMLDKYIQELNEILEESMDSVEAGNDFSLEIKTDEQNSTFIIIDYIPSEKKMEGEGWEEEKGKEVGKLLSLMVRLKTMRGDYREFVFT